MKYLVLFLTITLLAASSVLSQTRKPARAKKKRSAAAVKPNIPTVQPIVSEEEPPLPPPPLALKSLGKEKPASDVFKTATIGKWGVESLSLPDDLINEDESSEPTTNKNVSWTTYARNWKQAAEFYPSSLEVDLDVTTWNTDFATVIPDLRSDLATPENLMQVDIAADVKRKNAGDSFIKDARSLEVGGVRGGFLLADSLSDKQRSMAVWYHYRYYKNQAQRINLTVTGKKDELKKALKIIQSLKLQTGPQN